MIVVFKFDPDLYQYKHLQGLTSNDTFVCLVHLNVDWQVYAVEMLAELWKMKGGV